MSGKNLTVVERWVADVNSGDIDAALERNVADDFVGHYSAMPAPVQGKEGWKGMYMGFIKPAFPDQKITIEMHVDSGDRIAVQTSWTATHKGDFVGIPATGRTVHVPGTGIMRIVGDKIAEAWIQEDFLGIYQQLTAPEGQ